MTTKVEPLTPTTIILWSVRSWLTLRAWPQVRSSVVIEVVGRRYKEDKACCPGKQNVPGRRGYSLHGGGYMGQPGKSSI